MAVPSLITWVIMYTALNILVFAVFIWDKLGAKVKIGRISETSLLLLAALGPTGALTAMVGFRHKTRHAKFLIVPVFFILHVLLVVWRWPQISG